MSKIMPPAPDDDTSPRAPYPCYCLPGPAQCDDPYAWCDRPRRCGNDGGVGIGAGHVCRCVREAGHSMTDYNGRAHGCTCGALWGAD